MRPVHAPRHGREPLHPCCRRFGSSSVHVATMRGGSHSSRSASEPLRSTPPEQDACVKDRLPYQGNGNDNHRMRCHGANGMMERVESKITAQGQVSVPARIRRRLAGRHFRQGHVAPRRRTWALTNVHETRIIVKSDPHGRTRPDVPGCGTRFRAGVGPRALWLTTRRAGPVRVSSGEESLRPAGTRSRQSANAPAPDTAPPSPPPDSRPETPAAPADRWNAPCGDS